MQRNNTRYDGRKSGWDLGIVNISDMLRAVYVESVNLGAENLAHLPRR